MKKNFRAIGVAACLGLSLLVTSCIDPLDVGSDLLSEDRASVGFSDTLKINARTERADSVQAFSPRAPSGLSTYLFGRQVDAQFGVTQAALYIQPLMPRDLSGQFLRLITNPAFVLDSVVLVLPLDSAGIYGRLDGNFGIEVYEVTEYIPPFQSGEMVSFYSSRTYATLPTPVGSATFRPNYQDSVFVRLERDLNLDTVELRRPHVRIPLDNAFGQRFLVQDSSVYVNDSTLLDFFKGLYLKPTGASTGLLNFALNRSWAGVYFYYRNGTDTLSYNLEMGGLGRRISQYTHDYTGSLVGTYLDNPTNSDSLLFVQGMQGLLTAFDIPDLSAYAGRIINSAEIDFYVAELPGSDLTFFPPISQIIALRRNSGGELVVIDDVGVNPSNLSTFFGGQPQKQADDTYKYTFNISLHAQRLIAGTVSETIYLAAFPREGNARRVILKGPSATVKPPVLRVTFTDI